METLPEFEQYYGGKKGKRSKGKGKGKYAPKGGKGRGRSTSRSGGCGRCGSPNHGSEECPWDSKGSGGGKSKGKSKHKSGKGGKFGGKRSKGKGKGKYGGKYHQHYADYPDWSHDDGWSYDDSWPAEPASSSGSTSGYFAAGVLATFGEAAPTEDP